MAQPYVGEIRMFGGNSRRPVGTSARGNCCPISENEVLFTLTVPQIAAHTHRLVGSNNNASTTSPYAAVGAALPTFGIRGYGTDAPKTNLLPGAVGVVGGSQPHTNFHPYLCISFIISLFGLFPSPN